MALVFRDWLNSNEQRAYPLNDAAPRDSSITLPTDILADAQIWLPRSAGQFVCLSSVGITKRLVTLTFVGVSENKVCASTPENFIPLAVVTLTRPILRHKNYPITPLVDGVGGWVSFGNGALARDTLSLKFADPAHGQLCDRCIKSYPDLPVQTLAKQNVSPPLKGLVGLIGIPGQIKVSAAKRTIGSTEYDVILIGLDTDSDPLNGVATLLDFAGDCAHRPAAKNCNDAPIESINNVKPNCDGNISLVFEGDVAIGDTGDGLIIDSNTGQECNPTPFSPIAGNDCSSDNYQPQPSSSSQVSSENSESSVSSTVLDPQYCELFITDPTELSVKAGSFSRSRIDNEDHLSYRLVSDSMPFEAIAADIVRVLDVDTGYDIKAVIRPRETASTEGHIIFGYANTNDGLPSKNYFMCGMALSHPDYPDGCFFLARRINSTAPGADSIGFGLPGSNYEFVGLVFDVSGAFDALQSNDDYELRVHVQRIMGTIFVEWSATWAAGTKTTGLQLTTIASGWRTGNSNGRAGIGAINSDCEFDSFGINCSFDFASSDSLV